MDFSDVAYGGRIYLLLSTCDADPHVRCSAGLIDGYRSELLLADGAIYFLGECGVLGDVGLTCRMECLAEDGAVGEGGDTGGPIIYYLVGNGVLG